MVFPEVLQAFADWMAQTLHLVQGECCSGFALALLVGMTLAVIWRHKAN